MRHFIIIFLLTLIGVHLLVFFFFVNTLNLQIKGKIILGFCLVLLSFSYVIARFLIGKYENTLTGIIYYFSSVWLGILACIFLFIIFSCIVILFLKLFKIDLDLKYLGYFVLLGSLVYVLYGIWNANQVIVKTQKVEIVNLPEEWKNKKVLFFADSHLGYILKSKFLEEITEKINSEKPDLLFISGDLFDGGGPDFSYVNEAFKKFDVKEGIYFVQGNHDAYFGEENFKTLLEGTNFDLIQDEMVIVDGVQILGVESIMVINTKSKFQSVLDNFLKDGYDKNKPSILLIHEPHYTKEFKDFGINLQLSGHTHDGQIWPLGYIAKWANDGNGYGLKTDGNYNIYVTNGVGTWGPPMRMFRKPEIVVLEFQ